MAITLAAADSNAQETLQPYASPILPTFLDSANVYPESVTVDQSSGTFFVGSVKEGTIYKGKIARPSVTRQRACLRSGLSRPWVDGQTHFD